MLREAERVEQKLHNVCRTDCSICVITFTRRLRVRVDWFVCLFFWLLVRYFACLLVRYFVFVLFVCFVCVFVSLLAGLFIGCLAGWLVDFNLFYLNFVCKYTITEATKVRNV